MATQGDENQNFFVELKSICVPLLANARLDARTTPTVLSLLASLSDIFRRASVQDLDLKPALISYVFFPLSSVLSRNDAQTLTDRVLEAVLDVMELLFRWWWWTCEFQVWIQVVMLSGSILGVGARDKGKSRDRAEETKEAAVRLLLCLIRDRSSSPGRHHDESAAKARLTELLDHAQTAQVVPILGQILNALLDICSTFEHLPLQSATLEAVYVLLDLYVPELIIPTILPGVVSTMTRVALGKPREEEKERRRGKGWVNGEIVVSALRVLDVTIVRAVGDNVCLKAGIVKDVTTLEDIKDFAIDPLSATASEEKHTTDSRPYETLRTSAYLRATSSQLLIALNTLFPVLLTHPTPAALVSVSSLSTSLLLNTRLTLPSLRPLLLGSLLTLSNNPFTSVSHSAKQGLMSLLGSKGPARHEMLQATMQIAADALGALPRLIPARSETQIMHVAGQIEAVCRLGLPKSNYSDFSGEGVSAIRAGVGKLLGPAGGIEKWGWRLLSTLRFDAPPTSVAAHGVQLLESYPDTSDDRVAFPAVHLEDVASADARQSLERMLRALGQAGGEECLFSVEWLVDAGLKAGREEAPPALWCACRIFEGVLGVYLTQGGEEAVKMRRRGKALDTFAKWIGRVISDIWEKETEELDDQPLKEQKQDMEVEDHPAIEFTKGLTPVETKFNMLSSKRSTPIPNVIAQRRRLGEEDQLALHRALALQLLSASSSALQSRVGALLLHALYPLLHSLVSNSSFLSSTAFAALQYISNSAGYASPANLLLANFDYALDGVARRLTKRRLDPDAPKVLVVLVRLVGKDVVERAGDVVEECFERLDEYHGYKVIVEGLVEVLFEVVRIVEAEMNAQGAPVKPGKYAAPPPEGADAIPDDKRMGLLLHWLKHRHDPPRQEEEGYGPAPREAWGKGKAKELDPQEEEEEKRLLHNAEDVLADPPASSTQLLVSQIISRSLYFLTHGSLPIRARVLALLTKSVPVLATHESSLLPVVHKAWPFVVNRLGDAETYVVSAAAGLIEALVIRHGQFMTSRIWDDVWPRFRSMLGKLDAADAQSALARSSSAAPSVPVGTESAYTHAHRLYRAMLNTMTAAVQGDMQTQERRTWDVMLAFRRFLDANAHPELQDAARALFAALGKRNPDAVWLALVSTVGMDGVPVLLHLKHDKWNLRANVEIVLEQLGKAI